MTGPLTSQITKTSTLEKFNLTHNLTLKEKVGHFCLDERFDRYTHRHHVPGSIDSFHVYIFCDASKIEDPSSLVGNDIKLSGKVGKLDERLKPVTIIAGEEFFVIVSLDNLSPDESSQYCLPFNVMICVILDDPPSYCREVLNCLNHARNGQHSVDQSPQGTF